VDVINENGFIDICNTHATEKLTKKFHNLYQLINNSSPNMKNEFLNCLVLMMNSTRFLIDKELDIISSKIIADTDDGAKS
jgi:hypothetical protein